MKRQMSLIVVIALGLMSLNALTVTAGEVPLYGKEHWDGDGTPQSHRESPLTLSAQPEDIDSVTIGTGTELVRLPLDFWFLNSLYETLYLEDELGFASGTISSLSLYSQFSVAVGNGATKIFMGSTDQESLGNGFISAEELTLVFDGNIDYQAGENTITINLQTPYMHPGGNLVVMFSRPMDTTYYSPNNYFRCQAMGPNRARNAFSDGTTYDPYNPPPGTPVAQVPQITFYYTSQQIQNDLGALGITGNTTPTVGVPSVYTVNIRNNGILSQDDYSVKIMDINNIELASVAGPPIDSLQTLPVQIPWTPTAPGPISIYGKVVLDGDEIATNDQTPALDLTVNPEGVVAITVGEGNQDARLPIDFWMCHSLFQTLFFAEDIGGFVGQITGLKFYNNFNSDLTDIPISIWLGTTTQDNLTDGFIPSTELTLVHDGPVDFPRGENTIVINFNEPFMYLEGGNLVMMVYKTDTTHYSSIDFFKCQTTGADRSVNITSDNETFDPASPPNGIPGGKFPKTTIMGVQGGVGHISGIVTDAGGQPLSGVAVTLNDDAYTTTTNTSGKYRLINVLPDTYTLAFNIHSYYEHTRTVELEDGDDLIINVTLQPLPQVTVTGTILASDTGVGIQDALIRLRGYENYNASTDAAGAFTITNVFADHTYAYNISAAGYTSQNGQINLQTTNHNMGEITLNEVAYAPVDVIAEEDESGITAMISWLPPDPTATEVREGFEAETFPPVEWTQTITNNGPINALGLYPTWCRVGELNIQGDPVNPTQGSFQAGLYWDYNHQDEWLITPAFNCPPNAYLSFDTYVFLGSTFGDHYYVKVTTDNAATWTALWDASAQTGGWNRYTTPITVDLSAYSGNRIMVAFQAQGLADNSGLRYYWIIDNLYIGNGSDSVRLDSGDMTILSEADPQRHTDDNTPVRVSPYCREISKIRRENALPRSSETTHAHSATRALTGYMVYRLQTNQEQYEEAWVALTDAPITELNLSDSGWETLPNGYYLWAVKAIYTNGVTSVPSFSNALQKFNLTGMIVGTVKSSDASLIEGATVTNGTVTTSTNSQGGYALTVPVGYHSVTAYAAGHDSLTIDDVLVDHNISTTLNFVLNQTTRDENHFPTVTTALNGNCPNPFNPETTISYSVKEPGKVKLEVYNIKGQLVRTLVDEEQATGRYKLIFNAKDDRGRYIASGVYLLRMVAPGYKKTSKMILMQ